MTSNILTTPESGVSLKPKGDIFTTPEAADYVRLGKPTLERFRVTGGGPKYCKLGGAVRYRRPDLDTWLETRTLSSTSDKK